LTLSSKNKIIIVGDLIIDNHYISDNIGRAAEYNAPKGILKKKYFQIGGAGMVLNGLMVIDKTAQLITWSNIKFKKSFLKINQKNIIYTQDNNIEKNRYWINNKLILQINEVFRLNKKKVKSVQKRILNKINKEKNIKSIILCDYRGGIFNNFFSKNIIKIAKKKGITTYIDQQSTSNNPDLIKFSGSNFLVLNKSEYLKAFQIYSIKKKNFLENLKILRNLLKIQFLIIKMGIKGSAILKNNILLKINAFKKANRSNTIGAGDFFLAKFVANNKINLSKRLYEANKYAYQKISTKIRPQKFQF
jgi:bifunctional ADP-heptose synthase (sugar kinase/adenylyltransferase)